MQHPEMGWIDPATIAPIHIALVKIRAPQDLDDAALDGVGRTLAQLGRLGLTSTIVVDCGYPAESNGSHKAGDFKILCRQQADRIVAAIDAHSSSGARHVENIIGISETTNLGSVPARIRSDVHVMYRKLIMTPLRRGVIPVITPIAYTEGTSQAVAVKANDIVIALTREFAGFRAPSSPDDDPRVVADLLQVLRKEVSLDRLIILDPLGGIPTPKRPNGYHVFLNMEQEFDEVKKTLLNKGSEAEGSKDLLSRSSDIVQVSDLARGNPFSTFAEREFTGTKASSSSLLPSTETKTVSLNNRTHIQNLELVQTVLSLLPQSSSALLTTPEEAANSGKRYDAPFQAAGVGTRRKRNPLIHNLLTDKPVFSSSLPAGRLGSKTTLSKTEIAGPLMKAYPTTFAKRGMPVTIFPNPRTAPWVPPAPGQPGISLTDPQIDLPRLVHLIDDSFNRKLDVQSYLKRINNRIAGVVIAGEYEGGALLTWECPPGVVDDGSEGSRVRMVPYLDKFAVLKRSQGSGGVADIVFGSMVRECFPNGVCWRSRRDNPVNKWYFERSRGTWKMPGTNWTMFWTTPDLSENRQMFLDYEAVCRSIEPTWADVKATID